MLCIKAEGFAGMDLKAQMLPEMLNLAILTNCSIEVKANDTTFIVYPEDTMAELNSAYDRLYPASSLIMSSMQIPFKRERVNASK